MMKPEHANHTPIQLFEELVNKRKEFSNLSIKLFAVQGKLVLMKDGALLNSDKKEIKTFDYEILNMKYRFVKSGNEVKQFELNKDGSLKEVHVDIVFEGLKKVQSILKEYEEMAKDMIEGMLSTYSSYRETSTRLESKLAVNEEKVSALTNTTSYLGERFPHVIKRLDLIFKEAENNRRIGELALRKSKEYVWSVALLLLSAFLSYLLFY